MSYSKCLCKFETPYLVLIFAYHVLIISRGVVVGTVVLSREESARPLSSCDQITALSIDDLHLLDEMSYCSFPAVGRVLT
jgi:hypothetical protein